MPRLWTIGHSTHELHAFVELLREHGIEILADVRRTPRSRRWPQFHDEHLAGALPAHAIRYEHLPALGGRRRGVPGSPNGGWENASFRAYADHGRSEEFAHGLERLCALARGAPTAAMCSEGLWWRCHRRLIADRLVAADWRVTHIGPDGRATEHALASFARVEADGRLIYPPVSAP